MSEEIRLDIINIIARSSGYDIALMTTFNYDINFFEREIFNQLYAQDVRKVSVFVDSEEFTKALSAINASSLGMKYMVEPVHINGAFHPKLILLLSDSKARLIIGSSNLTTSGLMTNNEVVNCIDYSKEHPDYLDVINDAISFFISVSSLSYRLDKKLLEEVKDLPYFHTTKGNGRIRFVHNLSMPIMEQLENNITGEVEEIDVAVPYYDNDLKCLSQLMGLFPDAKVKLYIQNNKSSFPVKYFESRNIDAAILPFSGFSDISTGAKYNFYHGKVFQLKTNKAAYILYGSANCTLAALSKTYKDGGNVECDILAEGSHDDFAYYFKNMCIEQGTELKAHLLEYEKEQGGTFYYKYGEILKDEAVLHIGFKKQTAVNILFDDIKLNSMFEGEDLIAYIPLDSINALPYIFQIELQYGDSKEELICWTFSKADIDSYRQNHSHGYSFNDFEMESNDDKYLQDRMNLISAETMCLPEFEEQKKRVAFLNQIEHEQEENEDLDDYIANVEIIEEYRKSNRLYKTVEKIRTMFLDRFMLTDVSRLLFADNNINKTQEKYDAETEDENEKEYTYRAPTSEERKFERFIRSRIKGMMNQDFVNVVTAEHYMGIVAVLFDIFDKYREVDLFDYDYIIETKTDLFTNLLKKKDLANERTDIIKLILKNCYAVLWDNFIYSTEFDDLDVKDWIASFSRVLLRKMEKVFSIRSIYKKQVAALLYSDSVVPPDGFFSFTEMLFGYKNYEMLISYIRTIYPNAKISNDDRIFYIDCYLENIKEQSRPSQDVLSEILKYSKNVSTINTVNITIHAQNCVGISQLVCVEHVISFLNHSCRTTRTWNNGNQIKEKPEFINI